MIGTDEKSMIEIYSNLYIGNQQDYESAVKGQDGWSVVHACKEPYHRQALGYSGRAAPKTHPEYLIARRDNRLILNLVDAPDPAYIPKEIIDAALAFIAAELDKGQRVLVHCNQGESRSPAIGLLYLATHTEQLPRATLVDAESVYRSIYPLYNPAGGMRGFLLAHWEEYTCSAT
jgi:hypothetical protein